MASTFTSIAGRQTVIELDTRVLDRLIAQTPAKADQIVKGAAYQVEAEAKASMPDNGTGRIYVRGGIPHQASSPGEPPAIDTGNLINSIQTEKEAPLVYRVNVGAEYGVYLEFGTSRMAARPFLFPAVFRVEKALERRWLELLR